MPPFYTYISASAPSFTGLLDDFPNAAAAYSLRRLSSTYNGSAIRVRRSSDNTELDIGFVNNELDTASLLSFVGAGNGYVTTWYDQSGNNYHASQAILTRQPQIVSGGSVLLENSKPCIYYNGSYGLQNTTGDVVANNADSSVFFVGRNTTLVSYQNILFAKNILRITTGNDSLNDELFLWNTNFNVNKYEFKEIRNFNRYLLSIHYNGDGTSNGYSVFGNNSLLGVSGGVNGAFPNQFSIGYRSDINGQYWTGNMQELIIYGSTQFSNNANINKEINSHYSIYP